MRPKLTLLFGLAAAGLLLAGCGRAVSQSWPGMASGDGRAYVAQGQQLHAVEISSGAVAWTFPPQPSNDVGALVAEPGISDDLIAVGSEGPAGTYSGVLYGLDPANGAELWCLAFDQRGAEREGCPLAEGAPTGGLFGLSPAVDNRILGGITITEGVVYVGLANGHVYAVEAATGRPQWMFDGPERDVWGAPQVVGDTVYFGSLDHRLYAVDRATGALRWQQDLGASVAGTPTHLNGTLYVGTFGNRLVALDAATGQQRCEAPTNNWVWSGPALFDGILYVADVAGNVYAFDEACGELWQVKPGAQMRSRPAVTEELLYIGDREGNLFALSRADGSTRWVVEEAGQLLTTPAVSDGLVVVAPFNGDNVLVGYDAASGEFRWAYAPSR